MILYFYLRFSHETLIKFITLENDIELVWIKTEEVYKIIIYTFEGKIPIPWFRLASLIYECHELSQPLKSYW